MAITNEQQATVTEAVRALVARRHPAPGVRGYDLENLVVDREYGEYAPIATFCGVEVDWSERKAVLQKAVIDAGMVIVHRYGYQWVVPASYAKSTDDVTDPAEHTGWLD